MYTTNEILFPFYAIPELRESRSQEWGKLVKRVMNLPETDEAVLAFMLMMIRFNGCLECETDSYRAMRGCTACALQTLRRYKGLESDLLATYDVALEDIQTHTKSDKQNR